ncbi:MAG TPA: SGNH/GDSL hydrolase family protein [Thermoanaerobaculia bacterium]|nr:SGNH/GDSL hydrolase family protein [Thermoanaerobaculia bacterium]
MHRLKTLAGALALALLVAGAAFGQVNTGGANFSTYVAMGDSLTAGFSSGSLVKTYQVNSYPALLYRQATGKTTGFEQPLVSPPGIPGILRLTGLFPTVITATPGLGQPLNLNLPRPYNNIAVPGATLHDLLTKTQSTSANDITDLILRQQGATQLQEGLALHPTFVTLWIGNNDALAAATSGIAIEGVTLTPPAQFTADYNTVVNAITAAGARMAVANIPDVTSIPFVTTIPRFLVNPRTNQLVLINGQPVPLIGPDGPLQAGDYVLLTASSELAQGRGIPVAAGGTGQPLSDNAVLSAAEVATIKAHVAAYNSTISSVASAKGLALVDANALLNNLAANGIAIGGIEFTSAFLTGGIFGYDGVHPTALGYAYIANQFIDAINAFYGADIPEVDLYPFVFGPLPNQTAALAAPLTGKGVPQATGFVFTPEARRSLLQSLNLPKWIVDGTKPPRKPRHPRG